VEGAFLKLINQNMNINVINDNEDKLINFNKEGEENIQDNIENINENNEEIHVNKDE